MRAVKSGKPNGATIILRALLTEPTRDELGARLNASGFNRNGLGATLSKLKARGYVKRTGEGEWRLTPKGHELEERLRESVAS
jgi:Mn-dependent DtxR family transcriptional regulator